MPTRTTLNIKWFRSRSSCASRSITVTMPRTTMSWSSIRWLTTTPLTFKQKLCLSSLRIRSVKRAQISLKSTIRESTSKKLVWLLVRSSTTIESASSRPTTSWSWERNRKSWKSKESSKAAIYSICSTSTMTGSMLRPPFLTNTTTRRTDHLALYSREVFTSWTFSCWWIKVRWEATRWTKRYPSSTATSVTILRHCSLRTWPTSTT